MNTARQAQPGSDDPASTIGGIPVAILATRTGPCVACALNPGRPADMDCRKPKSPAVLYLTYPGGETGCSGFKKAETNLKKEVL